MSHPIMTTDGTAHALSGLLTPIDVSLYLGVPPGTLANWRYLGKGPAFLRVGRHVRYRAVDVTAWVDEQLQDRGRQSDAATERGSRMQLRVARR